MDQIEEIDLDIQEGTRILNENLEEIKQLEIEIIQSTNIINKNKEKIIGLNIRYLLFNRFSSFFLISFIFFYIRCLNQHLLSIVFGYLNLNGGIYNVCKYWRKIVKDNRKIPVTSPEKLSEESIMNRSMRKFQLSQLKAFANSKTQSLQLKQLSISSPRLVTQTTLEHQPNDLFISSNQIINTKKIEPLERELLRLTPTSAQNQPQSLLMKLQNISSEKQTQALIEHIEIDYQKLEKLENEKRKLRKMLKTWNITFEKENGRLPSNIERKNFAGKLYEEYQKVYYYIDTYLC